MSDMMHALQTPRRREILRAIWDRELSAGEIHRGMNDVTFGAVSQHLRVLSTAGLVRHRRQGKQKYYQACPEAAGPLRAWLESMWESSLYQLKLQAELDSARRGPQQAKPRTGKRGKSR